MGNAALYQAMRGTSVGSADSPLGNLLKLAAEISDCPYSTLIAAHPGRDRIVAGWGLPFGSYRQTIANTPEIVALRENFFQIEQAHLSPEFESNRHVLNMGVRFVVGVPVTIARPEHNLSLVCGDFRENVTRPANLRKSLEAIAEVCSGLIRQSGELMEQAARLGKVRAQVSELIEDIANSTRMSAFLDDTFRIIRATAALENQVGARFGRDHRPHFSTLFPADLLTVETAIQAINEGQIPFRIISAKFHNDNTEKAVIVMRINGADVDQPKYVIDIVSGNLSLAYLPALSDNNILRDSREITYDYQDSSLTSEFLFNTLIESRKVNHRKQVAYHSIRRWKVPIKDVQIEALRIVKKRPDETFIQKVANELLKEASTLYGADAFEAIAAVPCGHSGPNCLSCRLAKAMAAISGKVFYEAFDQLEVKGSSHPKGNVKRPKMVLRDNPIKTTLLIDDVATSGSHISEAAKALRGAGATVFPIAWIAS